MVLPVVDGRRLTCTLEQFVQRCLVHLEQEQGKSNPDSALIALLCDAVRLEREYVDMAQQVFDAAKC
jgi:hypothetical protein